MQQKKGQIKYKKKQNSILPQAELVTLRMEIHWHYNSHCRL